MPRISDISLFSRLPQHTLHINYENLSVNDLREKTVAGYVRLNAYLGDLRAVMAGNPYVAYHRIDYGEFDVEIGFVVAHPLPGKGDIISGEIPESLVASCMFLGPYNGLTAIYREMEDWITSRNLEIAGSSYEYYYNGRNYPPQQLLTKVVIPVV